MASNTSTPLPQDGASEMCACPRAFAGTTKEDSTVIQQTRVATSRREAPEALMNFPPKEGVGNAGCPLHPQPRVRFALIKMHTSKRVHRLHPTFPHAMVLRLITCSPRRSGSFATVALRIERFCPARLSRTSLRKT